MKLNKFKTIAPAVALLLTASLSSCMADLDLGRIDLLSNYSLFDVKAGDAKRVVKALKNADFFGKRIYADGGHGWCYHEWFVWKDLYKAELAEWLRRIER